MLSVTTVAVAAIAAVPQNKRYPFRIQLLFTQVFLKCYPLLSFLLHAAVVAADFISFVFSLLLALHHHFDPFTEKRQFEWIFFRFYLEVIYTIILFVECWWLRMVFLVLLPPHTRSLANRFCGWHVVSQCNDIFEVNRKWYTWFVSTASNCILPTRREKIVNAQTNQHKTRVSKRFQSQHQNEQRTKTPFRQYLNGIPINILIQLSAHSNRWHFAFFI